MAHKIKEESSTSECDETTKKKKYVHEDQHDLNPYNRNQILEHLKTHGYDEKSCKKLEKKFPKLKPGLVADYINKRAELTQKHVGEECNKSEFNNLSKWIQLFEDRGYNESCKYEISMIMKIIAETELHPPTNEDDIDFPALYNFLSDITRGNPPKELNPATEQFLEETFQDLLKEVHNEKGRTQLQELGKNIVAMNEEQSSTSYLSESLNPLNLKK